MSKPVSRGTPSSRDPNPVTTLRNDRSLTSIDAPPGDLVRIEPRRVAVEHMGVDCGSAHVGGGGDGVDVAGEVQVEQLHRHDLAVPAARCAALDPERRPHRRLANRERCPLADVREPLAQSDGDGRLALAEWRRCDRRDHDVLRTGTVGHRVDRPQVDLRGAGTVGLEQVERDPRRRRDVGQWRQLGLSRDLEIRRKRHGTHLCPSSVRHIGKLSHNERSPPHAHQGTARPHAARW